MTSQCGTVWEGGGLVGVGPVARVNVVRVDSQTVREALQVRLATTFANAGAEVIQWDPVRGGRQASSWQQRPSFE